MCFDSNNSHPSNATESGPGNKPTHLASSPPPSPLHQISSPLPPASNFRPETTYRRPANHVARMIFCGRRQASGYLTCSAASTGISHVAEAPRSGAEDAETIFWLPASEVFYAGNIPPTSSLHRVQASRVGSGSGRCRAAASRTPELYFGVPKCCVRDFNPILLTLATPAEFGFQNSIFELPASGTSNPSLSANLPTQISIFELPPSGPLAAGMHINEVWLKIWACGAILQNFQPRAHLNLTPSALICSRIWRDGVGIEDGGHFVKASPAAQ
ncbi:hypothetical protein C8R47DRAFT_1205073 [Mycena vitilis]|nr:hypothetical protein C8R47DRAFT_1205073 [Mycena vitilis]